MNQLSLKARGPRRRSDSALSHLVESLAATPGKSNLTTEDFPVQPSRNQRQLNADRSSFDGGQLKGTADGQSGSCPELIGHSIPVIIPKATFKAALSKRCFNQFDRKTDCFDGGLRKLEIYVPAYRTATMNGNLKRVYTRQSRDAVVNDWATFKAVCGTQTRLDGFQNKYQPGAGVKCVGTVPRPHRQNR